MLVLAAQASLMRCVVTPGLTATVIQHLDGLGGAMAFVAASVAGLVVASVVAGEDGELMDTPRGNF